MKIRAIILLTISLAIFPLGAITVDEIIEGSNRTTLIPNLTATFLVKMISQNGDLRELEAKAYQKLGQNHDMNRLFQFENPPRVRGTALLVYSSSDGSGNDMWIYLPAVRRVKRIALNDSGGGNFMGSDFTFRDLIRTIENDGIIHEIIGEEEINGTLCYVMKSYGETREIQKQQGYGYTLNYHRKEDFFLYSKYYYDLAGELEKVYNVLDEIHIGDAIYPNHVVMENVQNGHKSDIELVDIDTEEIPDDYFTPRYLKGR